MRGTLDGGPAGAPVTPLPHPSSAPPRVTTDRFIFFPTLVVHLFVPFFSEHARPLARTRMPARSPLDVLWCSDLSPIHEAKVRTKLEGVAMPTLSLSSFLSPTPHLPPSIHPAPPGDHLCGNAR